MDDLDTSPRARTDDLADSGETSHAEQPQPTAASDAVAVARVHAQGEPATFQPLARSEVLTVLWGVFLGLDPANGQPVVSLYALNPSGEQAIKPVLWKPPRCCQRVVRAHPA